MKAAVYRRGASIDSRGTKNVLSHTVEARKGPWGGARCGDRVQAISWFKVL